MPNDPDILTVARKAISGGYWIARDVMRLAHAVIDLSAALAECYRLSGADPDGNDDGMLATHAVEEVRRMRKEYDAMLDAMLDGKDLGGLKGGDDACVA